MLTLNEHLLNQVLLIAYQAGKHLQQFYQKQVHVELKEDNTPVTEADLFVSQFLTEKLTALLKKLVNCSLKKWIPQAVKFCQIFTNCQKMKKAKSNLQNSSMSLKKR